MNRLIPDNATRDQPFNVGGQGFSGNEQVSIYLNGQLLDTHAAAGGEFGQLGVEDVSVSVPHTMANGFYNLVLQGMSSGRRAVDVFRVRDENPVDVLTYSQWDSNSWYLHPGDNPT